MDGIDFGVENTSARTRKLGGGLPKFFSLDRWASKKVLDWWVDGAE